MSVCCERVGVSDRKERFRWGLAGEIAEWRIFSIIFVDFPEKKRIIPYCMDTQNDSNMASSADLAFLRDCRRVVGTKQLRKALRDGTALRVYLAMDADPAITEPLAQICGDLQAAFCWVPTMQALGQACGIEVGAAAAAAVKPSRF